MKKNVKYYKQFKEKLLNHLGNKCVHCGSTEALEVDHIDPTNKKFNVTSNWSYPWDTLIDEINKCQLLCIECHTEKHAPEHGTMGMYRHRKCRCDACRLAWNEKSKQYKRKAREKLKTSVFSSIG